jgi:hypothetical protein
MFNSVGSTSCESNLSLSSIMFWILITVVL